MKNRFIVFGLKNISREEQEIMMVTIMHVLRQKIEQNQAIRRATLLIADEGQMLCRNAYSAEQLPDLPQVWRNLHIGNAEYHGSAGKPQCFGDGVQL